MTRAFISMGSNQGKPIKNLKEALLIMNNCDSIQILRVAPMYLTEPVGYEDQEWFHNTVAEVETSLDPEQLLKKLQETENELGRVRTIRWGPRTLDLDIILYDKLTVDKPHLQIPHPRMEERAFVLAPLHDLEPEMILPSGKSLKEALEQENDKKFICISQKIW